MSGWSNTGEETAPLPSGVGWAAPVRHGYPLAVRDASLVTAFSLLLQSLPYAVARFGVLLGAAVAAIVWLAVTIGGAAFLGGHVAYAFGWVWAISCVLLASFVWGTVLRYVLHLIDCGHVAVLTELVTRGAVGNGSESMFAYGRRIVTARFAQANVMFGLNALVRGVVESVHGTLDWLAELIPIPGFESISRLVEIVLMAVTRYVDKVIFSYTLARADADPWRSAREGLVYYAQNTKPVLQTAIWSVILERVLSVLLWLVLLAPAGVITLMLPQGVREVGGVMTVLVALLLVGPLRAAFLKPLFLIMMMVRFHAAAEGQPINAAWDARLASMSEGFRTLGRDAAAARGRSRWARGFV